MMIVNDKERIGKLEKKLEQRKLQVYEILQEDIAIQWLKTNNPAFLSMLNPEATIEAIKLLITPGPPHDKLRSYKIPMVAAELLSTMLPKIYEILFAEDPENSSEIVLGRLLNYFNTSPNYVISGYVVRILINLIPANPSRVIQYIYKSQPVRMLNFLQSQSIAEFLLRIIIIQDALLNLVIKERVALLGEIVSLYINNKADAEILANANWILSESVHRLWSNKHKELGRFSTVLFKLVQAVIDNNNLYQQESLMVSICKQVAVYQKQAPFLIAALYKKIYQELSLGRNQALINNPSKISKAKLTSKRYKCLQAVYYIVLHGSDAISKQLVTSNIFSILIDYITRYQWHSLALIEIEKIFKAAILSSSEPIINALSRSYFLQKLQEISKTESNIKFGNGYNGLLQNVSKTIKEAIQAGSGLGNIIKQNKRQAEIDNWILKYINKQKHVEDDVRVVHEIAKPFYSFTKLPQFFAQFFQETEEINARMQIQSPSKHPSSQEKQVLEQIQKQNELVYKLLSQIVSDTVSSQGKKSQAQNIE